MIGEEYQQLAINKPMSVFPLALFLTYQWTLPWILQLPVHYIMPIYITEQETHKVYGVYMKAEICLVMAMP